MENTFTQSILLSKEIEIEGFDLQAGKTWIYPTNYPMRDYQYNITQKALLKNTLVSLPTGLGKTFIAAVVMYNIYRWYPQGKIIFMAPTKPLVKQQVDACYNIMAIPSEVTAELTGAKASNSRTNIWAEKRVFFVTPQVLQNDLDKIGELGAQIKCLVFDEAHRAKGNHAYCEVIRKLHEQNHKYFRVLALSATPGNNVNDVLEVIQNLLISHIEFRTEESIDVAPYVFQRSLETVVVPLDKKLEEVKEEYLKILEQYVKTLIKFNVIQGNCCSLTKGKIFMVMKDFQNKNRGTGSSSNYSEIMRCLNICVTLYHAFELLIRHGLRSFLSFYDEHIEKPLLRKNTQLRNIINNVREYLGPIPNIEVLPDGTYPEIPKNVTFGHPKYFKLRDILVSHFSQNDKDTRVIVFFEYRESVMEAHTLLLQSRPLIQPKIFLGQGSGITQKVQIGVVKAFREGRCNTLLSTCIGEEGLDVGEVDLIVCFDISNKSPIRMVQRMGRTGRKREGRIIVLVTEGREQQTLKDCLIHKNNISTFVFESKQLNTGMYPNSPRLVPANLTPKCEKLFITVKKIAKKQSIKDMLRSISSSSSEPIFPHDIKISEFQERIPKTVMLFNKNNPIHQKVEQNPLFYKHIESQRTAQKTHVVKHSKSALVLTDLLLLADSKRFNLPTQVQSLTQRNAGKNLKQSDIRNMFLKKGSQVDFEPTQTSAEVLSEIPTQIVLNDIEEISEIDRINVPNEVFAIVSDYVFAQMSNSLNECRHCPSGFSCDDFVFPSVPYQKTSNNRWVPSEDILDTISLSDIENFIRTLDTPQSSDNDFSKIMEDDKDFEFLNNVEFTQLEQKAEENKNIKADIDKSFSFEAPKTYANLMSKFGNSIFLTQESTKASQNNQNLGINKNNSPAFRENLVLDFFMLGSIKDLFTNPSPNSSQETVIYSQELKDLDINEKDLDTSTSFRSPSPVLSSDDRRKKILRKRISQRTQKSKMQGIYDYHRDPAAKESEIGQSLLTDLKVNVDEGNFNTQLSNTNISEFFDLSYFGITNSNSKEQPGDNKKIEKIEEICDLTEFGIFAQDKTSEHTTEPIKNIKIDNDNKNLNKSICDLDNNEYNNREDNSDDDFDMPTQAFYTNRFDPNKTNTNWKQQPNTSKDIDDIDQICDLTEFGIITQNRESKQTAEPMNYIEGGNGDKTTNKKSDLQDNLDDDFNVPTQAYYTNRLFPNKSNTNSKQQPNTNKDIDDIDQICDLTEFGIITQNGEPEQTAEPMKYIEGGNGDKSPSKHVCSLNNKKSDSQDSSDDDYNLPTQAYCVAKTHPFISNETNSSGKELTIRKIEDIDKICDLTEFGIFTQDKGPEHTAESVKSINNSNGEKSLIKNNQKNSYIEDNSDDDFVLPTQPFCAPKVLQLDYNKSCKTLSSIETDKNTQKHSNQIDNSEEDMDKTIDLDFDMLTQPVNFVKKYDSPKAYSDQESEIFEMLTQPVHPRKISNILQPKSDLSQQSYKGNMFKTKSCIEGVNRQEFNVSLMDTHTNANRILTCESQVPVTQMVSLLNDSSQKENLNDDLEQSNINKSKKTEPTVFVNKGGVKKLGLSIKKKTTPEKILTLIQSHSTSSSKIETNPYSFSTQFKSSNKKKVTGTSTSSDEFEDSVFLKPNVTSTKPFRSKTKKIMPAKSKASDFLDLEAELSEDENNLSSDESDEDNDFYEKSFVNDETQNLDTQMHANYLQSIRSPARPGRFKIPVRPALNISNVYSQPPLTEMDTYMEDSFCVDSNDIDQENELSQLEILELKLKQKKKRKKSIEKDMVKPKRRRVICYDSADSD